MRALGHRFFIWDTGGIEHSLQWLVMDLMMFLLSTYPCAGEIMAFGDSVGVTIKCGGAIRVLRICGQRRKVDVLGLTKSARHGWL